MNLFPELLMGILFLALLSGDDVVIRGSWTLLGRLDAGGGLVPEEYFAGLLAKGWTLPEDWSEGLAGLGIPFPADPG